MKSQNKKEILKRVYVIIGSIIILAIIIGGFYNYFTNKQKEESIELVNNNILTREFNHKYGPKDAKVKLVEFYDPECEACAAFYPYVKEIMNRYDGRVQLIVRYALYHSNSYLAAKASEAAAKQGKFWEFQQMLFERQTEWSHSKSSAINYFNNYAKELNIDLKQFSTDMNSPNIEENINTDIEDGKKLEIKGTPTFYINGKVLTKFSPDGLAEMIENELRN